MNLKQHRPPARRGKRWDAPISTSNPATGPDFIQAEVHDSFRGKKFQRVARGKRWDAPLTADVAPPTTTWPPAILVAERRRAYRLARGKRWECVSTDTFPEQRIGHRAAKTPLLRKGKRWDVIGAGVDAFYGLWKPSVTRPRVRPALLRRGKRWDVIDVGADILYGLWRPSATRGRVRVATPRRGRFLQLVSSAASLPAVSRPKRVAAVLRRGRRFDAIQVTAAPILNQVPLAIISSRRKWYRLSRGRRFDVPTIGTIPMVIISSRRKLYKIIRGRRSDAPVGTTFFQPSNPIPWAIVSSRRKWYRIRRGRRFDVTPTAPTVITTVWPPTMFPRRLRIIGLLQRKGKRWEAIRDQERPITIKPVRRPLASTSTKRVRRVIPDQLRPVAILRKSRRAAATVRRGRRWDYVRDQFIVIATPWVSPIIRSRRAQGMLRRGSRYGNLLVVRFHRVFDPIMTGRTDFGEGGSTDSGIPGSTDTTDLGVIDKSDGGDVL